MIDPTFKSELMDALGTAVSTFNGNPDPNAAVVKAARAHNFNTEQTRRLVETFNTARTLYQYERGEKTAQFPLADQAQVLFSLFQPTQPETKAATEFHDYAEYDQPERMAKAGHVTLDIGPITDGSDSAVAGMTVNGQAERAYRVINSKRAAAQHGYDVSRQVELMADQQYQEVASSLRRHFHEEAVDRYSRLKLAFAGQPVFEPIMRRLDGWVPAGVRQDVTTEKLASYGDVVEDRDIGALVACVKEAQRLTQEACNLQAMSEQLHKEAASDEAAFVGVVTEHAPKMENDPLGSFFPKRAAPGTSVVTTQRESGMPAYPSMMDPVDYTKAVGKATRDKTTVTTRDQGPGLVDKALTTGAETLASKGAPWAAEQFGKAQTRPMVDENIKMTERLKNVQRQVVLQDLMFNDPMIAETDPQTVSNTYNAVLQLAPEVTANKEVMRAILRQAVHSVAISPFDATSWVELERIIQDVRGKRPPQPGKGEDKK
jgi:hypothetical protein